MKKSDENQRWQTISAHDSSLIKGRTVNTFRFVCSEDENYS